MPSTFFGLSIGTSGLYTYQAALNTTGHNVSNAETPGYSRQEIVQVAGQAISVSSSYGMSGTGVVATGIIQHRSDYYDTKYRNNNSILGNYKSKEYYMLSIQNYFSEVNADGTTKTFNDFNNALMDMKKDPSDPTYRTQVVSNGTNFTEYVKSLAKGLQSIQEESNFEIKNTTDRINSLAESIASVTKQINTIEMTGNRANDLRDSRANMLDELSTYVNITVKERVIGEQGLGVNAFEVRIDGQLLVDTYYYNTLLCEPSKTKNAQNDIDGLYNVSWSNGQSFNPISKSLGGTLQALLQVRDGNNLDNLKGNAEGTKGESTVKLTGTSCDDINKLNIPAADGIITIDNRDYEYDSFSVEVVGGRFEYTFQLKEPLKTDIDHTAHVGESIDYKGIPYYMAQLNEYVRTYSSAFNELHNQGEDLNGNKGVDFFTAKHTGSGLDYDFAKEALEDGDIFNSLSSATTAGGKLIQGSYYHMTALNFGVAESVNDPRTIAAAKDIDSGVSETEILDKLIALKSDSGMYKQGTPDAFLQNFTGDIGVEGKKATTFVTSQSNILESIETQRMSISGVDNDEEALNLVKYKYNYDLSAKVIQIMNEIYERLINGIGV